MPLYNFSVYGQRPIVDVRGTQLPDVTAARSKGMVRFADLVKQEAKEATLGNDWWLEISSDGLILIRLSFSEIHCSDVVFGVFGA